MTLFFNHFCIFRGCALYNFVANLLQFSILFTYEYAYLFNNYMLHISSA